MIVLKLLVSFFLFLCCLVQATFPINDQSTSLKWKIGWLIVFIGIETFIWV